MRIPKPGNSPLDEQRLLLFILRSASGTLALRVFSMGAIFLTRVLLARALGVEEFGIFSYALTWLDLLAVAAVFGSDRMIVRELAIYRTREDSGRAKALIRFSLTLTALFSLGIVGVAHLALWLSLRWNSNWLAEAFVGAPALFFPIVNGAYLSLAIILLALPLLTITRVSQAILRAMQHMVVSQVPEFGLRPLCYLAMLVAVAIFFSNWHMTSFRSLLLYTIAVLVAAGVTVALLRRHTKNEFKGVPARFDSRLWLSALLPLALLEGAYFINGRIAIVALGLLTNSTAVALFTVAERMMTLLALALYATNYALAPHFARLYAQGNWRQLQVITTWGARGVLLVATVAGLTFVVFADSILALFGTEFVAARPVLTVLVIGQLFNAFTGSLTVLLTSTYHERETTRAVVISAVINLIANALLIPTHGAVGAALASTLSLIYWNVHLVVYAWRSLGIDTTALGIFARKRNETP